MLKWVEIMNLPKHLLYKTSSYQEEGWDPINQFTPTTTFVCRSQTRTCISNVMHFVLCVCTVSKLKVREDCFVCVFREYIKDERGLFCWYWLNCWPSLFKLLPFMIWRNDRKKTRLEIISFWCIFQNNYMFILVSYCCMSHVEFCFDFCCFFWFFLVRYNMTDCFGMASFCLYFAYENKIS